MHGLNDGGMWTIFQFKHKNYKAKKEASRNSVTITTTMTTTITMTKTKHNLKIDRQTAQMAHLSGRQTNQTYETKHSLKMTSIVNPTNYNAHSRSYIRI